MKTDIGEFVVGAYLKLIKECDVIDYNVKPPGEVFKGLKNWMLWGFTFRAERPIYVR